MVIPKKETVSRNHRVELVKENTMILASNGKIGKSGGLSMPQEESCHRNDVTMQDKKEPKVKTVLCRK